MFKLVPLDLFYPTIVGLCKEEFKEGQQQEKNRIDKLGFQQMFQQNLLKFKLVSPWLNQSFEFSIWKLFCVKGLHFSFVFELFHTIHNS